MQAVAATFERRHTQIPNGIPIGLSEEFIADVQKGKQWQAFLRKNAIDPMSLAVVIADLREFLMPVIMSVVSNNEHSAQWQAGKGWTAKSK